MFTASGRFLATAEALQDPGVQISSATTSLLMHFDGADESTSFVDAKGHTFTIQAGSPTISTAQSVFGGASGLFTASSNIVTSNDASLAFGTGDFSIGCRVRPNSNGSTLGICGNAFGNDGDVTFIFRLLNGKLNFTGWTTPWITGTTTLTANTWHDVWIVRSGNTMYALVDGILEATANVASLNLSQAAGSFTVGRSDTFYDGWIDELVIMKGVAFRTGNYVVPNQPFQLV